MNFDKTSVSILTQVVFKEAMEAWRTHGGGLPGTKGDTPENEKFWEAVQETTLELARTILRVDAQINPVKTNQ